MINKLYEIHQFLKLRGYLREEKDKEFVTSKNDEQ